MGKIIKVFFDKSKEQAQVWANQKPVLDLSVHPSELALEKESDQKLNTYHSGGGNSRTHGRGYQGSRPGQGFTPKNARYMSNVQDLFWCDARNQKGGLVYAPDSNQHECFMVRGKKQEINSGGTAKMPDHYRCTITCAFCCKRNHYEDECYHKQRLSANLNSEAQIGGQGGKGKNDKGKRKSK